MPHRPGIGVLPSRQAPESNFESVLRSCWCSEFLATLVNEARVVDRSLGQNHQTISQTSPRSFPIPCPSSSPPTPPPPDHPNPRPSIPGPSPPSILQLTPRPGLPERGGWAQPEAAPDLFVRGWLAESGELLEARGVPGCVGCVPRLCRLKSLTDPLG